MDARKAARSCESRGPLNILPRVADCKSVPSIPCVNFSAPDALRPSLPVNKTSAILIGISILTFPTYATALGDCAPSVQLTPYRVEIRWLRDRPLSRGQ